MSSNLKKNDENLHFWRGVVGGHVAARLLADGRNEVSVVARGSHLAAIQRNGLRLAIGPRSYQDRPFAATDAPATLAAQDVVIVGLKAQALPGAAAAIHQLLKPDGVAVFLLNGIPWWWRHGLAPTNVATGPLKLLDPQGDLWRLLRERSLGCVCHASNEVIAPGVIEGTLGDHWVMGDPEAAFSARLDAVLGLFQQAGFAMSASADLRRDIWRKLLVNASLNTVSALTRRPTLDLTTRPELVAQMMGVMQEVMAVSQACGWEFQAQIDDGSLNLAAMLAPVLPPAIHRSSMLQDVLAGRSLETEAILGKVLAFAREVGVATPLCDVLLPLLRGLDRASRIP